jgi:hypothetical protein
MTKALRWIPVFLVGFLWLFTLAQAVTYSFVIGPVHGVVEGDYGTLRFIIPKALHPDWKAHDLYYQVYDYVSRDELELFADSVTYEPLPLSEVLFGHFVDQRQQLGDPFNYVPSVHFQLPVWILFVAAILFAVWARIGPIKSWVATGDNAPC